jgi:hypothetical protein
MEQANLTFGWYLPTSGDSRALGDPAGYIPQSRALFDDTKADGIPDTKEIRYEKMDEEVQTVKRLWASDMPIGFKGRHC